jgi:hypothetical protein
MATSNPVVVAQAESGMEPDETLLLACLYTVTGSAYARLGTFTVKSDANGSLVGAVATMTAGSGSVAWTAAGSGTYYPLGAAGALCEAVTFTIIFYATGGYYVSATLVSTGQPCFTQLQYPGAGIAIWNGSGVQVYPLA